MRRLISSLILAATLCAAAPVPRKAPEFVITMPDGKQTLLSSYKGKDVVLAFMFTTCPHCQNMTKVLSKIGTEYASKGVQMLGATFDPGAAYRVPEFIKITGANFPVGVTSSQAVMDFLQLPPSTPPFVPILVFIDKTGAIRTQYAITSPTPNNDSVEEKFYQNPDVSVRVEIDKLLKPAVRNLRR